MACWWGCSALKLFKDLMYCREKEETQSVQHQHFNRSMSKVLERMKTTSTDTLRDKISCSINCIQSFVRSWLITLWRWGVAVRTYRFFDDVKALLIYVKGGHLLDDLLQQDVLFVIVTFDRQLQRTVIEMQHYQQTENYLALSVAFLKWFTDHIVVTIVDLNIQTHLLCVTKYYNYRLNKWLSRKVTPLQYHKKMY